jgi:hypothetical protein
LNAAVTAGLDQRAFDVRSARILEPSARVVVILIERWLVPFGF